MNRRVNGAFVTLVLLLSLALPTFVFSQQTQTPSAPRRGDSERGSVAGPVGPTARTRRERTRVDPAAAAAAGIEGDLAEALTIIEDNYVDGVKLDYNNVFKSSIIGMLRSLDPHSNFYDAKEYEDQKANWRSEYYGIGATIGDRRVGDQTDTYILATFEKTPAGRAGLRFGDRIVEIDGQSVRGKTSAEVRDRLRGPQGSIVKLTIERASTGNREIVQIARDAVSQPTVPDYYMIRPGVGYIDMTDSFNYTTGQEFVHALEELRSQGMTSLVLDLRNNGGGILEASVKVAEQFLQQGQIILTQKGRGARATDRVIRSENSQPDNSPLVVLINRGTASASEILAGALQDHDRALIIGETSFGKGLVQSIMQLDYGTALTLTTSKYFTPSGRLVQRDYSGVSFYDYIYNRAGAPEADDEKATQQQQPSKPTGPEAHTDTGRPIYGGGGIAPDEAVKSRVMSAVQQRLVDPVFAFARELVNGRISGFESYKIQRPVDFKHNLQPDELVVDEKLFKAFKEYVATKGEAYRLTEAQIDKQREFVKRQLRYDLATASYGSVKAVQVYMADDPQVTRAIESLPRARELAAAAMRGRNPPQKSYE
ncbi:MAG TPA: S41 family peptidase [Pyrinomonadaceae bacterium]|nr:S41 family peptidase [Pyrinomonadaceae bacterium]